MRGGKDYLCDVCRNPIVRDDEAYVVANNFVPFLEEVFLRNSQDAIEATTRDGHSPLVNAITREYFQQFENEFSDRYNEPVSLRDLQRDGKIDGGATGYRLRKVLEMRPEKFLFLLGHGMCIPEEETGSFYNIPLEEITKPEDAINWGFHLDEKNWMNHRGFIHTLAKLFDRR